MTGSNMHRLWLRLRRNHDYALGAQFCHIDTLSRSSLIGRACQWEVFFLLTHWRH